MGQKPTLKELEIRKMRHTEIDKNVNILTSLKTVAEPTDFPISIFTRASLWSVNL
jgi:hypothetical protein